MQPQKPDNPNNPQHRKPGGSPVGNLLLWGFLITVVLNLLSGVMSTNNKTQIEYGQFVKLIDSGAVDQVQIDTDQLLIALKEDADAAQVSEILGFSTEEAKNDRQKEMMQKQIDQILKNGVFYAGLLDDPGLTQRLIDSGVHFYKPIVRTSPILDFILSWILPFAVMYLIYYFLMRSLSKRMGPGGGMGGMMNVGKSKAKVYSVEKQTSVKFTDVAGQDEAKESLDEIVDFLHNPEKYKKIGAKQPKGALLVGPPGTGKTLLAKAVAGEAGVPFFSLSGSEFVEMFVGVGASRVRDLFEQAAKQAPCIVFIDEIDAIGKSRDNPMAGGNDEREQTLNQLLAEMDGFDSTKGIVILAATNRPEILDKALLRPGRFDRRVVVERPDLPGREGILRVHAAKVTMDENVNLREIALSTSGATGADLANMVNEAALRAVRMGRDSVAQEDLTEAVELVIAGKEKKDRILSPKEKRMVSFHEIGHALATALQKEGQPVQKITIVPRTMGSLGYTMNMPEEERYLMTRSELMAQIVTLLAGRAAEEIEFGEASTGASNDIERATQLARSMVTQYGMSEAFDMMALESVQHQYLDGRATATCSEQTGAKVDEEVRGIIRSCHEEARMLLQENIESLRKLAEYLIEKETITGTEFMSLLRG